MSGFANIRAISDATDSGNYLFASFRKQATQTTGAGVWFDLSMSPGNPAPNYYIGSPNVFVPLKQSTDGGLRHGGNVSQFGKKKFLRKLMALTSVTTPISCKLLDYLGFYGFVDESVLDEQFMDNTQGLTRYSDGAGVQLMPVVVAGHTGGQPFTVKYTNQDGVSGRIAQTVTMGTQITNGTILHSQGAGTAYVNNGPFIPLQRGDTGVRSAVWSKVIEAGYSADSILRILASQSAGQASGLEGSNPQFIGLDGVTLRIDGTYLAGSRTIDALNGDV